MKPQKEWTGTKGGDSGEGGEGGSKGGGGSKKGSEGKAEWESMKDKGMKREDDTTTKGMNEIRGDFENRLSGMMDDDKFDPSMGQCDAEEFKKGADDAKKMVNDFSKQEVDMKGLKE